ncbi:MAG: GAF domain-containing protein [Burkholderiales bacterium]
MNPPNLNEALDRIVDPRTPRGQAESLIATLSEAEKSELILRLGQTAHRQSRIIDIASRVSDSLSLDVLFPRLMDVVTETLDADRSSLFLHDPDTNELFSRVMQGSVVDEVRFPATRGIAGAVFASGKGEIISDVYANPLFNREMDRVTGYRTRNLLCVPIRNRKQEVIGITQALNKHQGDFDAADMQLLEALSNQAAAALENARIFEKVERAQREEALLLEVVSSIASEIVLQPLLQKIVDAATLLLEAERGSLFLHDQAKAELYSHVAGGANIEEIRFPSAAGIAGECFTAGAPINIPNAYADTRFNQEVDRRTGYKTRNMLCMPITTQHGNRVGVMQILNKKSGSFGVADEKRLVALCAQAAVSIENAQLFEQVNSARVQNEGILRSMSNGVIAMDASLNITKINQAAMRLLRGSEMDLLGLSAKLILGARNPWILKSIEKVRLTGKSDITVDTDLLVAGRDAVSINLTVVPLITSDEQPIGYMLVIEDISTEKRLRNTMSRYMSKAVVDQLMDSGEAMLGGTGREVSVLFSDIRDFTSISERLGARETILMLNEYFTDMVDIVFEHNGILDKYIGDMIMAVFGSVNSGIGDADDAVEVGNKMMLALRELNLRRVKDGREAINIGVGISTGNVVVGNIGSPKRLEYTVIGDRVNLAERLESANKYYGTSVLLCQFTAEKLKRPALLREIDLIRVRGSTRPLAVFEALDHHNDDRMALRAELLDAYAEGLRQYRQRDWRGAAKCFEAASRAHPKDNPSRMFWDRCKSYMQTPPADNWDGVWTMGQS